jgi:hypothetical protein
VTPAELASACVRTLNDDLDRIALVIPMRRAPRGRRIRLDQKSRARCPLGEVAYHNPDPPRTVAWFDAREVLAWLAAHGLVKNEKLEDGS